MTRPALLALLLLLAGCGTSRNPDRSKLRPVPRRELPTEPAAPDVAVATDPTDAWMEAARADTEEELGALVFTDVDALAEDADEPQETPPPVEQETGTPDGGAPLAVAEVGGGTIDVRNFLARLWLRNPRVLREDLEQLVVERFVMLEAGRLGIQIEPELVQTELDRSIEALEEEIAETGSTRTVEEHIREVLDLDPLFYARELRRQSITHLIAQRAVRAWSMESERVQVRILELPDHDTARGIQQRLQEGEDFDVLVAERFANDPDHTRVTEVALVRMEQSALSRIAFATDVGDVGGPIFEGGRFLLLAIDGRLEATPGHWRTVGARVEAALVEEPIGDPEYLQWKAGMQRRYEIDFQPFLDLIRSEDF